VLRERRACFPTGTVAVLPGLEVGADACAVLPGEGREVETCVTGPAAPALGADDGVDPETIGLFFLSSAIAKRLLQCSLSRFLMLN